MVNVGGFFASLKLVTDSASFAKGKVSLENVGKAAVSIAGGFAKAALAVGAMTGAVAILERKSLLSAKSAGLSVDSFNAWSGAASNLGANAEGLISSIGALDSKFQQLKLGQVDENLAKNLSFLGLGFSQMAGMKSEDRTKSIMSSAMNMGDERKAAELVGQILGSAGKDFYYYMKLSGKSLESVLAESRALTFTTAETKKNAMLFAHEMTAVKNGLQSIGSYAFSKLAQQLTPVIVKFKEWLMTNKALIQGNLDKFMMNMGNIISRMVPTVKMIFDVFEKLVGAFHQLPKAVQGFAEIGMMIARGGILGQLSALYLLIEDIAMAFNVKGSITLTGAFLQSLGKLTGALDVSGKPTESWNNLFKQAKSFVDSIWDVVKNIDRVLRVVSNAGTIFKSTLAGTSQAEISQGIESMNKSAEYNKGGKIMQDFLASITEAMGPITLPGGKRNYAAEELINKFNSSEDFAKLGDLLKKMMEVDYKSIISDKEALQALNVSELPAYQVQTPGGRRLTGLNVEGDKIYIELEHLLGSQEAAAEGVYSLSKTSDKLGVNVKLQNMSVKK